MASTNGRAFNEWLRAQLKAKKMSQRQLAQQSGVDHSTISRLVRGDRMPSLGTATKLARGLREISETDDGPQYIGLLGGATQNPTARVEYSLRADDALSEPQVRQVMEYYLAVRMRRLARTYGTEPSQLRRVEPAPVVRANGAPYQSQAMAASGGRVAMVTPVPRALRPLRNQNGY
ncbi:MAG TPA: helix-turn-helix transcriptional regulator [Candidatus Limnocylindrales bacterium]|nr:helix-turn-helix transcriptional regulator [Candidatus Limnocylindrales bacterium]